MMMGEAKRGREREGEKESEREGLGRYWILEVHVLPVSCFKD